MSTGLPHLPPYARIAGEIKRRIAQQDWKLGEALPPQRQMSVVYGVTTATLNRAIGTLIEEGVLITSSGHGTFVARVPTADEMPAYHSHDTPAASVPKGKNIALIAPTDHDPLVASQASDWLTDVVAQGVERVVSAAGGYLRFYRMWHGGLPNLDAAFASARNNGSDGVILVNAHNYEGLDAVAAASLAAQRIPGILIAGMPNVYPIAQVTYSQEQAGFVAGEHLLSMGYQQIVAIRTVDAKWCDQRIAGAALSLKMRSPDSLSAQFAVIDRALPLVKSHGVSDDELSRAADDYLAAMRQAAWWAETRRTGVIVPSDHYALAFLGAMRRQGIAPGKHIGVVGFDDSGPARLAGLTSVRFPLEAMGIFAAEAVLRAAGQPLMVVHSSLLAHVTSRESTRRN